MATKKPTALGCYIFAGGFTVGVAKHFEVLAHFEQGPYGTETAAHNLPFLRGKIFTDPATWPVADYRKKVDFIYGNPPCAPWSVCSAGRAVPWRLDPRVDCSRKLFALIEPMEPKVWAFESVRPTFSKGREFIDEMVLTAADRGYTATALMVNGIYHGVAQKRPRFFLVLSRIAIDWEPSRMTKLPTVGDAFAKKFATSTLSKEGENSKFFMNLVRKTKQGQRCAALFNELYPERIAEAAKAGTKVKQRPSFQNYRLDPKEPSCTLTGGAKQIHPTEHRLITVEESAALCGYPRDFKFIGPIGKQYQQVAQAVMPPVGEYLARMVARALAKPVKVKKPEFVRVEILPDRVDVAPLSAQRSLPLTGGGKKTDTAREALQERNRAETPPQATGAGARRGKAATSAPAKADRPEAAKTRGQAAKKTATSPVGSTAKKPTGKPVKGGEVQQVRGGCGARIRELLRAGHSTDAILATVRKEFPWSKAKESDVSWNRRKIKLEEGIEV